MIIKEVTVNERVYCAKNFTLHSYDFVLTYGTEPLRSYSYGLFTHNVFRIVSTITTIMKCVFYCYQINTEKRGPSPIPQVGFNVRYWLHLQHHWSKNFFKNLNKLHGSQYPVAQCSYSIFFLKLLDQRCWIFDFCPRNFLIQEKQNGNVVSTSHWIRPVHSICYSRHHYWHNAKL